MARQNRPTSTSTRNSSNRGAFILEYLKDRNGTQAAIRAGYAPKSAHVTASRLLRDAKVQHAICAADAQVDADIAKAIERLTISKERAVARLAQIAFGDIREFIEFGSDKRNIYDPETGVLIGQTGGISIKASDQIPDHAISCLVQVCQTKHGLRLRFADRGKAIMDFAKLMGWIGEPA